MPTIYEDSLQKDGKHGRKHAWWEAHGVEVVRTRFDGAHGVPWSFGDYCADGSNVVVDTKADVDEIAQNVNGRSHDRFKRECMRAQDAGCRLVVLVENVHGYTEIAHVNAWTNGHCAKCCERHAMRCDPRDPNGKCARHGTRKPIQGPRLAKAMSTMGARYGVRFMFCRPTESARIVCELLGVDYE